MTFAIPKALSASWITRAKSWAACFAVPRIQRLDERKGEESKQISRRLLIGPISEIATLYGVEECPAIHTEPLPRAPPEGRMRLIN